MFTALVSLRSRLASTRSGLGLGRRPDFSCPRTSGRATSSRRIASVHLPAPPQCYMAVSPFQYDMRARPHFAQADQGHAHHPRSTFQRRDTARDAQPREGPTQKEMKVTTYVDFYRATYMGGALRPREFRRRCPHEQILTHLALQQWRPSGSNTHGLPIASTQSLKSASVEVWDVADAAPLVVGLHARATWARTSALPC